MQNCSVSIEHYCFKHKNLVGFRGRSPPEPIPGALLSVPPLGSPSPDPPYRLALPHSPCAYYYKILRISPETVCHEPCATTVCHSTLSNGCWKRTSSGDYEHRPAPLWRFCNLGAATQVSRLTYLLTHIVRSVWRAMSVSAVCKVAQMSDTAVMTAWCVRKAVVPR